MSKILIYCYFDEIKIIMAQNMGIIKGAEPVDSVT